MIELPLRIIFIEEKEDIINRVFKLVEKKIATDTGHNLGFT